MKLISQNYGKARVRVLKVFRDGTTHTIKELSAKVALDGDFEASYTQADNSLVVPTDTMKNTVNVLAHEHLGHDNEPFAQALAGHFLRKYPQVKRVTVELDERVWSRLSVGGRPHAHSFSQTDRARPFTSLVLDANESRLESGVRDYVILKSIGSGFAAYPKCELTTLPETHDRILATSMSARWLWSGEPVSFQAANAAILQAMIVPFAENYSPSVQATIWEMGGAALKACPEISQITIAMPNLHCLLINLAPFNRENRNEVFVPTDEPHGQIEATIAR